MRYPMRLFKLPSLQIIASFVVVAAFTWLAYGTYGRVNWQRVSWQRGEADRIRQAQMLGGHTEDPNVVFRASWAAIDDSTYESTLLQCPSVGFLRFGTAWDNVTG